MNASSQTPVTDPTDRHWAALAEAETLGQPLSPHDLWFLRMHVPSDPTLRAEHALRWALAGWGEGPMAGEDDEAVIAAAVGAHLHGGGAREQAGRGRVAWIAAAAGLAVAAGAVLAVLVQPGEPGVPEVARVETPAGAGEGALGGAGAGALGGAGAPGGAGAVGGVPGAGDPTLGGSAADGGTPGASDPADGEVPGDGEAAQGAGEGALRSLSGTWVDDSGLALAGAPAPGTVLTATSEACLGDAAGGRLCVQPGARVRAVAAEGPAIEWLDGRGELTLPEGPAPQVSVLEWHVAGVRVSGPGASLAVETTLDGRWSLTVREGHVKLETPEGTRSLTAGERWAPDEGAGLDEGAGASGRSATPEAAALLRQARSARAGGEMAEAAALYRKLLKAYPRSPSAGPAWVALGQVELARGRATAALEAFDRYLERGGGPLAEEAAYGRIEALRKLGRAREERTAIERFLGKYPGSSYAAKLQHRP